MSSEISQLAMEDSKVDDETQVSHYSALIRSWYLIHITKPNQHKTEAKRAWTQIASCISPTPGAVGTAFTRRESPA